MSARPFPESSPTPRRPGLCFTEEEDRLYEIGWPHLAVIVDDHPHDKKPDAAVAKLFKDYFGAYHTHWPRKVAEKFVRALTVISSDEWAPSDDDAVEAMKKTGPIEDAELEKAIARQVGEPWTPFIQAHFVHVLEALTGTDKLLEALVTALERTRPNQGAHFAFLAGFPLLRASEAARRTARARLEALYDRSATKEEGGVRFGLDLALHAGEGAARALANDHWQYLQWYRFNDDLALLRTRLADTWKSDWSPDARLVWLCGPELLSDFLSPKVLRKAGKQRKAFLSDVSMFRHPAVAALMADSLNDKQAGTLPEEWLRARGAEARSMLEAIARKPGPSRDNAKALLRLGR